MSEKATYICEAQDGSSGRPATIIFLHGYADDAEGLPLGLAQQFQWNSKLPYLRWVLPNAPMHPDARERAWYMPKALPSAVKPRVPGHEENEEDGDDGDDSDDEKGIMESVARIDQLVQAQIDDGVDPGRIIVGGFSQGCAVSLVWGLTGRMKDKVGGVVCASGYFPLARRITALRGERGWQAGSDPELGDGNSNGSNEDPTKWLFLYGSKDLLVPTRLFQHALEELKKWIKEDNIQTHRYEGMGHSTCNAELRDMLHWFEKVIPA